MSQIQAQFLYKYNENIFLDGTFFSAHKSAFLKSIGIIFISMPKNSI